MYHKLLGQSVLIVANYFITGKLLHVMQILKLLQGSHTLGYITAKYIWGNNFNFKETSFQF